MYDMVQIAFALSFLVVRLGIGLPASFYWWLDMVELLRSGKAHSRGICVFYLARAGLSHPRPPHCGASCTTLVWRARRRPICCSIHSTSSGRAAS